MWRAASFKWVLHARRCTPYRYWRREIRKGDLIMRNARIAILGVLSFVWFAPVAYGQEGLSVNGSLHLSDRVNLRSGKFQWQEYRLALKPSYEAGEKVKFRSEVWVRELRTAMPFETPANRLQLREAYLDLNGLLHSSIDIRIGRQRIAWGSADRLNPSDNLNPQEFEDFWDFGRHTPTNSLLAKWYVWGFTLEGVVTPWFEPSQLPDASWNAAFLPQMPTRRRFSMSGGFSVDVALQPLALEWHTVRPSGHLSDATYGVRLQRNVGNYTLSAGWVRQHSPIPVLSGLELEGTLGALPTPLNPGVQMDTKVIATLSYPIRQVVSADFAGALGNVGIWGEGALFIPSEVVVRPTATVRSPLGTLTPTLPDTTVLSASPYAKYTFGLDYTFPVNLYMNVQYAHGFAHEAGSDNLTDWLAWVLEWKSPAERWKVALLNGTVQVKDFNQLKASSTIFWLPEVAWLPIDGLEVKVGAHAIFAGVDSPFRPVRKNGDLYLQVGYAF